MDKKARGSWVVHHTNKLQGMTTQRGYENIFKAGKAGILLSALAADTESVLTTERVQALADAARINTSFELPALLSDLQKRDLIDQSESGVAVVGVQTSATLQHVSDIFDSLNPKSKEIAAISLAENTSSEPSSAEQQAELLGDEFKIPNSEIKLILEDAEVLGFVDAENIENQKILFNGNLFRSNNAVKVKKILDTLNPGDRRNLTELTELLRRTACVEYSEAHRILGDSLVRKILAVGLFDVSIVSNNQDETAFLTLPAAFAKYGSTTVDDAFDLAKAFVSSITYGMTKSSYSRGRIVMVVALISTLVRGEPVGPVNAIAQDYKILELKGVIRVTYGSKNGRSGPMMWLLKKEVGELALQVIRSGDVSEHSLDSLPGAAVTRYKAPEENRAAVRRVQLKDNPLATNDIIRVLRGGGYK